MITIDTLDSLQQFEKIRENWENIYCLDGEANHFLSWRWLAQLYDARHEGVFVLAVKVSEQASDYCAFFPFRRVVRYSDSRQCFFNSFTMAGNYWADSTGLICDPDFDSIAIPALAKALKTLPWQRVLFESFRISAERKALFFGSYPEQDYIIRDKSHTDNHGKTDLSRCPVVELPTSFELYLEQKLSANTRQKIRRIRRKIEDDSSLSIVFANVDTIEQHLAFFEQVWIDSWKEEKGRSVNKKARKYSTFIRKGVLSEDMIVPVLLYDSKPVGILACYTDPVKGHLLFFVAGRDVAFDVVPVGLALHTFCIEWAIERGYSRYDLLRGDEPYKYSLGATDILLDNVEMFKSRPAVSAQVLHHDVKKPTLRLLAKLSKSQPDHVVHSLHSQILESWPGDRIALSQYRHWLDSIGENSHAKDIQLSLDSATESSDEEAPLPSLETVIDIEPFARLQNWIDDLEKRAQSIDVSGAFDVKGLRLEIAPSDGVYFDWLKKYLCPLVPECSATQPHECALGLGDDPEILHSYRAACRLVCAVEDDLIVQIMRLAQSDVFDVHWVKVGKQRIERIHITSELTVDINRLEGVVWVSNKVSRQLTLLMSNRLAWPSLEVSRTARAIIISYMMQSGWHFLHSGAVNIEGDSYLIMGDEGQGKTSLLLALMSSGCAYISNEKVFARFHEGEVEVMSFPMPVAIGLGAAQQYPSVMQYVDNPEYCSYPHRRMDTLKLRSTPRTQWSTLSDKVQLLLPELTAALGSDRVLRDGKISGIIMPSISKYVNDDFNDKVNTISSKERRQNVERNRISKQQDIEYPAWVPLSFNSSAIEQKDGHANELLRKVSSLPTVRFEFHASQERKSAVLSYPKLLKSAFLDIA